MSAPWLPENVHRLYRLRLHSGFFIGPEKHKHGWQFCARCRQAKGVIGCTAAEHEDVLHACVACTEPGGAADVGAYLLERWKALTREDLPQTGPTLMFGDRRAGRTEEQEMEGRPLEGPWRAAHAAVMIALDKARVHAAPRDGAHKQPVDERRQTRVWSKEQVLAVARRESHKLAQRCYIHHKNSSKLLEFQDRWVKTGLARITKKGVRMMIFDSNAHLDPTLTRRHIKS